MSEFALALDPKRAAKYVKQLDAKKINEFLDLVGRAYKNKPAKKDLAELREWIDDHPELWRVVFDFTWLLENNFIQKMVNDKAAVIAIKKNTDEIRAGFDYSGSTILEQMLIDNIVISWLGVQFANFMLTTRLAKDEKIVIVDFWDKRASAAQRRYLRACESLMRIRRLMSLNPGIQINIAANGGQQVNVAGNVKKK